MAKNEVGAPSGRGGFLKRLLLAIVIVAVIGGLIYLIVKEAIEPKNSLNVTQIKNVFIDVNEDGLIDYISDANVILNTGNNLNLPVSP